MRTQARAFVVTVVAALTLVAAGPARAGGQGPNDPGFGLQWAIAAIGAPEAWSSGTGEGVTIAVVDSGVDLDHEDLAAKIDAHVSCIGSNGDAAKCSRSGQDDDGHGTHVAGIAAAATGNGRGVAGVAPGARLMSVRVLEHDPATGGASGSAADVFAGIVWAVDNGADVVNLSLGENVLIREVLGSSLEDAVRYAWNRGAIPVVAAGNDVLFDSGYDDLPAVVVTATNRDGGKASYANAVGDAEWGLAAPGGEPSEDGDPEVGILSTWLYDSADPDDHKYAVDAGTSMAAPHVAGAAAVLRSLGLSPADTVNRLLATATDIGPSGPDRQTGAGRLDLAAATQGLGGAPARATTTTAPPPVSTTTVVAVGGGSGAAPGTGESPVVVAGEQTPSEVDPAPVPSGDTGQGTGITPGAVARPDADETASRAPLSSGDGSNAALWLVVGLTAALSAPVGWRWLRTRPGRPPTEDLTPW